MHAPLVPPGGLHVGCPQPALETPQNPCPAAEWVPSSQGRSGEGHGWGRGQRGLKALTWVSCLPPSRCPWVGLAEFRSSSSAWHDHETLGGASKRQTQQHAMGQHSPRDPLAHLCHGLRALSTSQGTSSPRGQAPPSVWGHLQMAAPSHTKLPALCWCCLSLRSHCLTPGTGGSCPAHLGRTVPCSQPSFEPPASRCHLPGPRGSGFPDPLAASPPQASSLLPGCPGTAPVGDSNKCQEKVPSCSAIHPTSAVETLWSLLSPALSSAEGNGGFLCGPSLQGCAGGGRGQQRGRCWQLWLGRECCLQPVGLGQARLGTVPCGLCSTQYLGSRSCRGRNAQRG